MIATLRGAKLPDRDLEAAEVEEVVRDGIWLLDEDHVGVVEADAPEHEGTRPEGTPVPHFCSKAVSVTAEMLVAGRANREDGDPVLERRNGSNVAFEMRPLRVRVAHVGGDCAYSIRKQGITLRARKLEEDQVRRRVVLAQILLENRQVNDGPLRLEMRELRRATTRDHVRGDVSVAPGAPHSDWLGIIWLRLQLLVVRRAALDQARRPTKAQPPARQIGIEATDAGEAKVETIDGHPAIPADAPQRQ